MSRNVTIVVIILVLVVIAGYLIWVRSKFQPPATPVATDQVQTVEASPSASASATPSPAASSSAQPKTATSSSSRK